jgi:hypothetical protein
VSRRVRGIVNRNRPLHETSTQSHSHLPGAFIIVFIFADAMFNLTGILRTEALVLSPQFAYVAACLVGVVGSVNVWLTWHYGQKANTMRDWLVVCAWTHRVKHQGRWITLEEFLTEQLGYEVSHGLSEPSLLDLRGEADARWRQFPAALANIDPAPKSPAPAALSESAGPAAI